MRMCARWPGFECHACQVIALAHRSWWWWTRPRRQVTVWVYAYKNCSNQISSALELDTMLYQNGQPLKDYDTDGYAHVGERN